MINGYEDINDNVKTQNGAWMTSWLSDHTEKLNRAIPDNDKDTVKISTWLLIVFLRYNCPKIHTERRNNNNNNNEVICHADKLRWYASTERIENLTVFPTSDRKLETTLPIAHSLSYNILNLGRKWSYNNRDTAQRSLPCRFMFGKNWPPIDITRKYDKLCTVAFNGKFDYDDVIKMKNKCHVYCRELSQLQHIKIWEEINNR